MIDPQCLHMSMQSLHEYSFSWHHRVCQTSPDITGSQKTRFIAFLEDLSKEITSSTSKSNASQPCIFMTAGLIVMRNSTRHLIVSCGMVYRGPVGFVMC